MEPKKIIYIGNYDNYDTNSNLLTQPSGNTKIRYILDAMKAAGINVHFISTAICREAKILRRTNFQYINMRVEYLFSFGHQGKLFNILSFLTIYAQLLIILCTLNEPMPILVYHSPRLSAFIKRFQFLYKKCPLYFEIEEIYAIVKRQNDKCFKREVATLRSANGYIAVNDIILDACHLSGKSLVCYGNYNRVNRPKHTINPTCIRIIYAGGLDDDAFLAISTATKLPSQYHLHILGYGSEEQIKVLYERIRIENEKIGYKKIEYNGCLSGIEYIDFLENCDVGLSTRNVDLMDSKYAFPSKILVYISHNLLTVSTPHYAISHSSIKDLVNFSIDSTAEAISTAICKSVEKRKLVDNYSTIENLNIQFINNLSDFFS